MKKILLLLFAIFYFASSEAFTQEEKPKRRADVLKEFGLKRHNIDYFVIGGMDYDKENYAGITTVFKGSTNHSYGTTARYSSNFYFTPENTNRFYLRANWIMIGIAFRENEFTLLSTPLNIGIGDNIKISENMSLDLSISGGVTVLGPGNMFYEGIGIPKLILYPEIKLQSKQLSLSIMYSRNIEHGGPETYITNIYHTVLIGLSRGFK